jgi:hypothetical protein
MDTTRACRDADKDVGASHNGTSCCKDGAQSLPNRTVLGILKHNGCMAEYITLPVRNLRGSDTCRIKPPCLPNRLRRRVVFRNRNDSKGDKVAILGGDGKLGRLRKLWDDCIWIIVLIVVMWSLSTAHSYFQCLTLGWSRKVASSRDSLAV